MNKEFYRLHSNYPPYIPLVDNYLLNNNRDFIDFLKNQKIPMDNSQIYFFDKLYNGKGMIANISIASSRFLDLIVLSEKIVEKFKELVPNIELFPSRIEGCEEKFYVVNLLDEVDCIDYENSNIKWGKKRKEYDNMKFIAGGDLAIKFFKEKEYPALFSPKNSRSIICVTEKFKEFANQNGIINEFVFEDMLAYSELD